jgi:2-methylisocitrate lyase-like PEP mutase family enzyme
MTVTPSAKRQTFRALHAEGFFVIPNPWDAGTAKLLAQLGFKALASTSAGLAWSLGKPDNQITLDEVLVHLAALNAATDLPVNADFEGGFADAPETVAANVAKAIEAGVAGLSIENSRRGAATPLYDDVEAVERIRAAKAAIDAAGGETMLIARCEGFLVGERDLSRTIGRLIAFAEAGADCLYAPGLSTPADISAVVKAVAPLPVNVLVGGSGPALGMLADLGVRRASVGGALTRAAFGGFLRAARALADGDLSPLADGAPGGELNKAFGS